MGLVAFSFEFWRLLWIYWENNASKLSTSIYLHLVFFSIFVVSSRCHKPSIAYWVSMLMQKSNRKETNLVFIFSFSLFTPYVHCQTIKLNKTNHPFVAKLKPKRQTCGRFKTNAKNWIHNNKTYVQTDSLDRLTQPKIWKFCKPCGLKGLWGTVEFNFTYLLLSYRSCNVFCFVFLKLHHTFTLSKPVKPDAILNVKKINIFSVMVVAKFLCIETIELFNLLFMYCSHSHEQRRFGISEQAKWFSPFFFRFWL